MRVLSVLEIGGTVKTTVEQLTLFYKRQGAAAAEKKEFTAGRKGKKGSYIS